jgi:hypothetical protein
VTKARELAELGKAVSVHDNRVDFDRSIQVPGLLDSAQVLILSTDSSEVTTIADNQALLNSLIFGG